MTEIPAIWAAWTVADSTPELAALIREWQALREWTKRCSQSVERVARQRACDNLAKRINRAIEVLKP